MQLQKHLNRVVAGKEYAKYLLVISPDDVEQLQWKVGEQLQHEIKDRALTVRPAPSEYKAKPLSANAMRLMEKHRKTQTK